MQKFHPSAKKPLLFSAFFFLLSAAIAMAIQPFELGVPAPIAMLPLFAIGAAYLALSVVSAQLISYYTENESLVMEKAGITQERKVIPLKSIDNIYAKSSLLSQMLSLSDVYVDTPGGFGCELIMKDVPSRIAMQFLEEVEKMKQVQ